MSLFVAETIVLKDHFVYIADKNSRIVNAEEKDFMRR